MRTQIGWYDPGSKRFCYSDVKKASVTTYGGYTVPVFAVTGSNRAVIRVLKNQSVILGVLQDKYSDQSDLLTTAHQLTAECVKALQADEVA